MQRMQALKKGQEQLICCASAPCWLLALILGAFALAPQSYAGWLQVDTSVAIANCELTPHCVNGRVTFVAKMNPFYADLLYTTGIMNVLSISWGALSSTYLCDVNSSLYQNYALPLGLCSASGQYSVPSSIITTQALSVLAILLSFFSLLGLLPLLVLTSRLAQLAYFVTASSCLACFAATLAVWNNFSVNSKFFSGQATVVPIWNATVQYQGQVYVRTGKYSGSWQDSYSVGFTNEIVASPPVTSPGYSPGYNLWIAALSFATMAYIVSCIPTVASLVKWRRQEDGEGSFGLGAGTYTVQRGNTAGLAEPIYAQPVDYKAYSGPPPAQRPSEDPSALPEDYKKNF